jgi:hypothetical protein
VSLIRIVLSISEEPAADDAMKDSVAVYLSRKSRKDARFS